MSVECAAWRTLLGKSLHRPCSNRHSGGMMLGAGVRVACVHERDFDDGDFVRFPNMMGSSSKAATSSASTVRLQTVDYCNYRTSMSDLHILCGVG